MSLIQKVLAGVCIAFLLAALALVTALMIDVGGLGEGSDNRSADAALSTD